MWRSVNQGYIPSVSLTKSKFTVLRGEALLQAIALTLVPIKWLRVGGDFVRYVDNKTAQFLVRTGSYEGKARTGRVYYIREYVPGQPDFDESLRFEMPVLRHCRHSADPQVLALNNCLQNRDALERVRVLRQRAFLHDVRRIPSGKPIPSKRSNEGNWR